MRLRTWQFRASRFLGRAVTRIAALATLGRMPPFVSTSALVVDGERVLVVIDPIRGEPVLPGGHLRWRETPAAGMIREVREETGYAVQICRLVGVYAGEEWSREPGVVRLVYEVRVAGGALMSSPEGEAQWISVAEFVRSDSRDALIAQRWLQGTKSELG